MSILPESDNTQLRFELIVEEAQKSKATIDSIAKRIRALAKEAGTPIEVVANTEAFDRWVKSAPASIQKVVAQYKTLISQALQYARALENIERSTKGGSQRGAVASVAAQDKWFANQQKLAQQARLAREQSALNFGNQLDEVNAMSKAWDELNARIKNGTASVKEFVEYLRGGKLSAGTMAGMQAILPADVSNQAINTVKKAMGEIQAITKQSTDRVRTMVREMFPNIDTRTIDMAAKKLQGWPTMAEKLRHSFEQVWNTIKGTLTAMAIFYATQPIMDFFSNALAAARKFRGDMAELDFSEMILSKKGLDVAREDFDALIDHIQDKFKYLSEAEATSIVTDTLSMLDEFDVPYEDMGKMAEGIAFVNLQMKLLGEQAVDSGSILNALMDARSNFFNRLGINITEQLILEKAYEMGLAKQGEQVSKTARQEAARALFIEQTSGKTDELIKAIEQLNPELSKQIEYEKTLSDIQLEVGNSLITIKDHFINFMLAIDNGGEGRESLLDWVKETVSEINNFFDAMTNAITVVNDFDAQLAVLRGKSKGDGKGGLIGRILFGGLAKDVLQSIIQVLATIVAMIGAWVATMWIEVTSGVPILKAWEDAGANAREAWISGWKKAGRIITDQEELFTQPSKPQVGGLPPDDRGEGGGTATGETSPIIETNEDLQKALEKMNDEILEAQLKLAQDMEEAAIDLGRKLEDITIEYARKRADAEIDYMSTVADINADYQNTIAQINQEQAQANAEANADALQREAEFQEQMRQLKERFLMDLEDALHARDARQILRLIKQYNLEKEQAEREYALEQENAQREQEIRNQRFQAERADAERQRQAKLAEARREYQDKLAKLAADEAAERAAAELAYQRKMEDLEREMQNRLEIVAANLVAEFNLTKEGLDAILALYKKYYAEVAQIYAAMNAMLAGQANVGTTSKPAGGPTGGGGGGGGGTTSGSGGAKPFAEGGTVIANRPTRALFGEKGLEMATFTPLGRTGQDVNKVFSNLSGDVGGEGRLTLEMLLSPDLEARIVQNTLGQTANVIMKVQRSK